MLGLGHRWRVARGVRLGVGYEHQRLLGAVDRDGAPIGTYLRDVVHGEVDLVRARRLKAGARLELRWDDTDAAERVQVLASVGADVAVTPAMTVLGRSRTLYTEDLTNRRLTVQPEDVPDTFTAAGHSELIAGCAYRPPRADWLDLFAQYAYQLEQRPAEQAGATPQARSHVASLAPIASLPLRLSLSGKLAFKRTQLTSPGGAAGELSARTDALLWLVRLGYRVVGKWELAGELRQLQLWHPGDAAERRSGALFEATYTLVRRVRLGVGYNLSRFSDNELRDLERDSHGLFMRVVGTY